MKIAPGIFLTIAFLTAGCQRAAPGTDAGSIVHASTPTVLTIVGVTSAPTSEDAATPTVLTSQQQPRAALTTFFSALHDRRYSEAAQHYGGCYDLLIDYNPSVRPTDQITLFKNACEANGFVCFPIKRIVREEPIAPTEYRFVVEFLAEDGSTFVRGPCCGASEKDQPSVSQFTYTVRQEQGRFLVQELPVYRP